DEMRMAMAERIDGDAGGEIEVALAAFGYQPASLAALECKGRAGKGLVKRRSAHYMPLRPSMGYGQSMGCGPWVTDNQKSRPKGGGRPIYIGFQAIRVK